MGMDGFRSLVCFFCHEASLLCKVMVIYMVLLVLFVFSAMVVSLCYVCMQLCPSIGLLILFCSFSYHFILFIYTFCAK